eukprot:CAMPEP_0181261906 /NCGR_PEP_ID=MMETSP1097-20121128/1748_1 /TAXON_ID=35684 /ORGANISM="Pseudopedinella elastica, Strain CCMP716" /LENGTH=157 /DNA_ID=CAMNT_0023360561 /DNA_START=72 /DNA_END=542 /DNA_ORIENTATION=+
MLPVASLMPTIFGISAHGLVQHVARCPAGHVVQHLVHAGDGFGNRLEVLIQAFLGRLVVVGNNEQAGICAKLMGLGRQFNGLTGAVAAGARNNRDATINTFDDVANGLAMLFRVERCGFAGGAHSNDAVCAVFDMKVYQLVQILPVDVTVWMHGRDQ